MTYKIDMDEEFNVYDVKDEEEANAQIAVRLEAMQTLYREVLLVAERFGIRVDYRLESDVPRGHNSWRNPEVCWNPSSQNC